MKYDKKYYLIHISKAHTKENIGLNCWCQCLWDFGQNLILGDFWQISRIINWYLVLIKKEDKAKEEEEEEEFEEVTRDWIRLASLNQAKKELCPHWQIIFHPKILW